MMNQEDLNTPEQAGGQETTPQNQSNEATLDAGTEQQATDSGAVEATAGSENVESVTPTSSENDEDDNGGTITTVEAEDDHETPKERKLQIPDYDSMTVEESLKVMKNHMSDYAPERIKGIIESGRSRILSELNQEREEARKAHLETEKSDLEFRFEQPLRKDLNTLYNTYRDALRKYYQDLEKQLSANLFVKTEIIESIKSLPMEEGSAKDKYEKFKGLRERWNATGPVPKEEARNVWANFNHHVDNFFDFMRLAHDLIEKDYEKNMAEKVALCEHLEELAKESTNPAMFRTLQQYHSKWKRIGPVPREQRDELWDRFKAVTAIIHAKRDEYNEIVKAANDAKIEKKRQIVAGIVALTAELPQKHSGWQKASKALNELRKEFKEIGFVKSDENDAVWEAYREAQRDFNSLKNNFYKEEKKKQRENYDAKKALVELAESVKDSEDFEETSRILKKAQADWKKTGYVNKKDGDQLWEDFRSACNHFFDRMHGTKKAAQDKVSATIDAKRAKLEELKKATVASIEEAIEWSESWSALGAVPRKMQRIEEDFDALLAEKLSSLGLSTFDLENTLFEAKVKGLVEADDQHGLMAQRNALRERTDAAKRELHQLENNLSFFSNSKGNPLLQAAQENIEKQKAIVAHLTGLRKKFNSLLK